MRKSTLAFVWLTVLLIPFYSKSQTQDHFGCMEGLMRDKLLKAHPEILAQEQAAEVAMKEWIADYKKNHTEKSNQGKIIIPLVFHILNEGGSENISDAQVRDEVRIMNLDYNKQNGDTINAVADFPNIIADMGVTWRLANIDPNGNCTNGIDRITTDQTYIGDDYSKLNGWDRTKYVNVWVVNKFLTPGLEGYAYYATDVQDQFSTPWMDGVIIVNNTIGGGNAWVLVHEIGHCFDLEHCWGNTNDPGIACGDDDVNDTPITKGWTYCPVPSEAMVCEAGVVENYQNYMEYAGCPVMFTEGQKERWIAAANSKISGRNNLWSDSNLIATGTYDTFVSPCAPIAGFSISKRYICSGNSVQFLNSSGNADTSTMSYFWQFPNGTPSTSTEQSPVIQFAAIGWQTVSLTVTNNLGSSTKTDSTLLFVGFDAAQEPAPYFQGFEDPNVFNENKWVSINYDADNVYDNNITWFKQSNSGYHTGSGAAVFNNYDAHANWDIDEMISPPIDLSALSNSQMNLSFYFSGATSVADFTGLRDSLSVMASTNCGISWIQIYKTGGANLDNAGYVSGGFVPGQTSAYWQKVNIPLTQSVFNSGRQDVLFKFQAFTTIEGNNLYIDDINIGNAATAIEDISDITSANIYPNPSDGNSVINLVLNTAGKVAIKVYDMAGQEVMRVFEGNMNDGETQLNMDGTSLASGVYIVNIRAGKSVMQKKLVIK